MVYTIKMLWDDEAKVWVATSDDIPGLILESGSYDALIEKVKVTAPELLEKNSQTQAISLKCYSERVLNTLSA